MALIFAIFGVEKCTGQLSLARIIGKKIISTHIILFLKTTRRWVSLTSFNRLGKWDSENLSNLFQVTNQQVAELGQKSRSIHSTPIRVLPLSHQVGTITPSCLSQDKIPIKSLNGAQLTFLSSSPRNTGIFVNWEWWLPGQGPEQRIVRAEILNQARARNRVETWQIFVEESSEYIVTFRIKISCWLQRQDLSSERPGDLP